MFGNCIAFEIPDTVKVLLPGTDLRSEKLRIDIHFARPVVLVDGSSAYAFDVREGEDFIDILKNSLGTRGYHIFSVSLCVNSCSNEAISAAAKNAYAENPTFFSKNFAVELVDLESENIPRFSKPGGKNPALDAVIKYKKRYFAMDIHPHKHPGIEDDIGWCSPVDSTITAEIEQILTAGTSLDDILPDGRIALTELTEV